MEPLIDAAATDEIVVGANLGNTALIEHNDFVGPPYCRQPVSNHDDGPILHQICEGALHQHLRLRIEMRCGLIKDQNRGVSEQRPGDRNPLSLTSAETGAAFSDQRIESLRQGPNKLLGHGVPCGGVDLIHGGAGTAIGNVRRHRGVEQECVLSHDADLLPQRAHRDARGRRARRCGHSRQ